MTLIWVRSDESRFTVGNLFVASLSMKYFFEEWKKGNLHFNPFPDHLRTAESEFRIFDMGYFHFQYIF